MPGFTIGPKRLTAPALEFDELPKLDIILLSHAHFDHFDLRTLRRLDKATRVITAPRTRDLLRWTKLRDITELRWNEGRTIETSAGEIDIVAFPVNHWGGATAAGHLPGVQRVSFGETRPAHFILRRHGIHERFC